MANIVNATLNLWIYTGDFGSKDEANPNYIIYKEKKVSEDYNSAIATADAALGLKNYETAKTSYQKAAGLKSYEQYPQDKIKEIYNQKLFSIE